VPAARSDDSCAINITHWRQQDSHLAHYKLLCVSLLIVVQLHSSEDAIGAVYTEQVI
jgi:hypothetical protein